jgi:Ni/Co efflux regulator RcnB
MKKFIAGVLLASVMVPVAAQAQDGNRDHDRREWQGDRGDHDNQRGRDDRGNRGDNRGHEDRGGFHNRGNYGQNDWRGMRDRNPNDYRRGNWRAPFAYRSFGVGAVVPRAYWGSRYYVNDWARYRLPRPNGAYRYVRHYDDVLLIDVRNGHVIRSYRGFYR